MKKLMFILILFPVASFAQQGFFIGATADNGLFWLYNKNDFNTPDSTFAKPVAPNGFSFTNFSTGIVLGCGISNRLQFDSKVNYLQRSRQFNKRIIQNSNGNYVLTTNLNYLSCQINFAYGLIDLIDNTVVPYIKLGISSSYLFSYYEHGSYPKDNGEKADNYVRNNEYSSIVYYNDTELIYSFHGTNDFIYSRFIYGISPTIGINVNATDHLQIGVEFTGQIDLNNTDNLNAKGDYSGNYWWNKYKVDDGPLSERSPSHNYYVGLGICIKYFFRSRFDI